MTKAGCKGSFISIFIIVVIIIHMPILIFKGSYRFLGLAAFAVLSVHATSPPPKKRNPKITQLRS